MSDDEYGNGSISRRDLTAGGRRRGLRERREEIDMSKNDIFLSVLF